jgi:diacylglycerol kinase family enzyme
LKAVTGSAADAEALDEWAASRLTVDFPHRRVHAAVDGEPATLAAPLEFELEPRALRVLVPPAESGGL